MQNKLEFSQEELNEKIRIREREDYYEDKILELNMKIFLDNYINTQELSIHKSKLENLKEEKNHLLREKKSLSEQISEIEEEKTNFINAIDDLDRKIGDAENIKKQFELEINSQQEFLKNITEEDNLVNYIINNFPSEFSKEIYDICFSKIQNILKNNTNKNNEETNNDSNKNKKESQYTMDYGQHGQFIPYPQKIPIPGSQSEIPHIQPMNPIYFNNINNNNKVMMYPYPIFMPIPQNMGEFPNPYYYAPMPIIPNMHQKKEDDNDKNNK